MEFILVFGYLFIGFWIFFSLKSQIGFQEALGMGILWLPLLLIATVAWIIKGEIK
jgi:hypothetical protein